MQPLGPLLRDARKASKLTLQQLADAVDAAPSYLSMIENQRVGNPPSADLLQRLEAALQLHGQPLRRAADWQTTPPNIQATVAQLAEEAERGRKLAAWLKLKTQPTKEEDAKHAARRKPGRDLDALYRSGQLSKRINAVLGDRSNPQADATNAGSTNEPDMKTPDADRASDAAPPSPAGLPRSPHGMPLRDARRVPLINRVAAGDPSAFTDLGFPAGVADDYLAVPGLHDPDAFATRLEGDSMEPDYRAGDIVVFSPAANLTSGCDAFVRLDPEHEVTFKRVYFDEAAGTVRLQPLNPAHAPRIVPREQVAGCFRAVWRFAKL